MLDSNKIKYNIKIYLQITVFSRNDPQERIELIGEIQGTPKTTPFKLLCILLEV